MASTGHVAGSHTHTIKSLNIFKSLVMLLGSRDDLMIYMVCLSVSDSLRVCQLIHLPFHSSV